MTFCIKQLVSINLPTFLVFLVLGVTHVFAQNNDIKMAREYLKQGASFFSNDEHEKSIEYYDKAGEIASVLKNDTLMYVVHFRKGHAYLLAAKNQEALDSYYSALELAQNIGGLDYELVVNSSLMLVLKRMNQLDKAHKIASQMLKSIDKASFVNTVNHARMLTTVSDVYLAKEKYDSVLSFAEKGIAISKSLDYKKGLSEFYIKKGMIFYYKRQYDESFKQLYDAEKILLNHDIKNKFFPMVNINYFLASCHYEQKDYDQAIDVLLKTTKVLQEKDLMKPPVIQTHLLLANCYNEKKDFEKALYWNTKYVRLNKKFQEDKDATINKIYKRDAEKLEAKIETLRIEKEAEEQNKKLVIGSLIFLSLILIGIVLRYINKQKTNTLIFSDLMVKINRFESEERETIAKKDTRKELIIDDDKVNEILKGLHKLEEQEYFLKSDCNLRAIAKKVKTNATYLSKIINIHKEKNYTDYINDLRIDYAVKRLKNDKKFRSFSIKSIATEIGYKSDYSFTRHFKAKTGLNPSYYIKNLEKKVAVS